MEGHLAQLVKKEKKNLKVMQPYSWYYLSYELCLAPWAEFNYFCDFFICAL